MGEGKKTPCMIQQCLQSCCIFPLCVYFFFCDRTAPYQHLTVSYMVLYVWHRAQTHSVPYKPVRCKEWIALSLALWQVPVCRVQCFPLPCVGAAAEGIMKLVSGQLLVFTSISKLVRIKSNSSIWIIVYAFKARSPRPTILIFTWFEVTYGFYLKMKVLNIYFGAYWWVFFFHLENRKCNCNLCFVTTFYIVF